jgi:hypothetical protein
MAKRAVCGGRNGGLSCLYKAIEMELLHIGLGSDISNISIRK